MLAVNFIVEARIMSGVSVVGYRLKCPDGSSITMGREDVEKLALDKRLINVTAQRHVVNGVQHVVLKGINCKLKDLPKIKADRKQEKAKHEIVMRVTDGKQTCGYVLDCDGEKRLFNRNEVMNAARIGLVSNARVQASGDKYVLRGVGCDLAKLPVTVRK